MIPTLIAGLLHGNSYALIAVGMSLIFGVTNVANFAQGSVFAIGLMLAWWLGSALGWGILPTALAVIVVTGAIGLLMNAAVIRPLEGRKPIAALLATIGVSQILDNLSQLVFGPQSRPFPRFLPTYNLHLGGINFGTSDVTSLIVTVGLMAGLWAFLKYGKSGQAIRATSQDPDAARMMGIQVGRIRNLAFVIGSVLAGIAGIFVGMSNQQVQPTDGAGLGMIAFVAATIGGLGSIPGAVVGGYLLGLVEAVGIYFWGAGVDNIIIFGVLLLVLIARPQGLFGGKRVKAEPMTGTFLGADRSIHLPWWGNLVLVALVVATPFFFSDYLSGIGTQVAIYAIAAVGLVLISGFAGQTILGAAGSVAIGAYSLALLETRAHWPFLLALLAAGLLAAAISSLFTFPIWKLAGHYLAIATIGVGFVVVAIIQQWQGFTNGPLGIANIPNPVVFGVSLTTPQEQYLLDVVLLIVIVVLVSLIERSHLGRVLGAVGFDEEASSALGIRTANYKALAYTLSAFCAGLAGALLASQYTYIDPSVFDINMSTEILVIAVLGGLKSPLGAVVGSVVLLALPEALRVVPQWRIVAYGLILILILLFRPEGLLSRRNNK